MHTFGEQIYARRARRMSSSAVQELLKVAEMPDIISFAGGFPAPEVFPVGEISDVFQRVLQLHGAQALQYSSTEGLLLLRRKIAQDMSRDGLKLSAENILITSGSQQALDLLGKILIDPGDYILAEAPTYLGALQAWSAYDVRYTTLPLDQHGMIVDDLTEALQVQPKFIYIIPNFQNPTGATLNTERRKQLLQASLHSCIPLVEDDAYYHLRYDDAPLPSLLMLDRENCQEDTYQGNIIYLGTFSKILAPGLRLGWVVAAPDVITKLIQAKQGVDLHTSTLIQMVAYEILCDGFLDRHVQQLCQVYRARRDAMLAAIEHSFPSEARWTYPQGGMYLWVTLPDGTDVLHILQIARRQGVAFIPGVDFYTDGGGNNTFRLNFSNASLEKINDGIARLGKVLHMYMQERNIVR